MNPNSERQWPAVVFFLTCGLFFFGCVWYLWAGAHGAEENQRPNQRASSTRAEPRLERNAWTVVTRDRGLRVGGDRIVYRGRSRGDLHLELFVLALDPHMGYAHAVTPEQARQGFRMGDHHLRVLAVSDKQISLQRM